MKKEYNWENKYIGLYYGHSGKSKGLDYLIQAIPDIIKQHKDMQLVFNLIPAQRDQVCKRAIQQQVQKLPKEEQNKVKVLDGMLLEKLRTLVACSNLVIAPSLAEWFGSVHTETTAMGKTLITTNIWPLPEVLSGNVIFIRPQNAQAIVKAIETARSGNIEKIPNKTFSWDVCVEKIEKVYEELLHE